eukprot:scaffold983_cov168-Amphora_coffeaeformis.AAC.7
MGQSPCHSVIAFASWPKKSRTVTGQEMISTQSFCPGREIWTQAASHHMDPSALGAPVEKSGEEVNP